MIDERHHKEIRAMLAAKREMDRAWASYQGARAAYMRAERQFLGHFPRSNPPGPFICDGTFIEIQPGYGADCEDCFSYQGAEQIP